jgi:hypothetical protein
MLSDAPASAELRNAAVSFDTPDKDYRPTQAGADQQAEGMLTCGNSLDISPGSS